MFELYGNALVGGLLIGLAVAMLLLANGRIAGISGILWGAINNKSDRLWRWAFVLGLPLGALLYHGFSQHPPPAPNTNVLAAVAGGLITGFGTHLGSGCTSGHGVCGISRLSPRSLAATCLFMLTGIATVYIARHLL